jgi:hypothetical protein
VQRLKTDSVQKKLLSGILIFNVLDIIFTLFFVNLGFAVEANPFMLVALERGEIYFASLKLFLVSASVHLLWIFRKDKLAQIASLICFCVYSALMVYHLFGVVVSIFI